MAPDNTAKILEPVFSDGDGEDGGGPDACIYTITVVENGFILVTTDDEGDITEVFHDIDDVFGSIRASF